MLLSGSTNHSRTFILGMVARRLPLFGLALGLLSSFSARPAWSLDLTSAGWSFLPATPGACLTPGSDFGCYENLTSSSITLIGLASASPPSTVSYSYPLPVSEVQQQVNFTYFFDPDSSPDSIAYYQVGSAAPVSFIRSQTTTQSLLWSPGETLTFGIDQVTNASWSGSLAITGFSSSNYTSSQVVPFPMPILGPLALLAGIPALRRNTRRLKQQRFLK